MVMHRWVGFGIIADTLVNIATFAHRLKRTKGCSLGRSCL